LPVRCGRLVSLKVSCYCPQRARCLRTGLTLRHVIPTGVYVGIRLLTMVNVFIFSNLLVLVSACEHAGSERYR
jgi:hypothetical protein